MISSSALALSEKIENFLKDYAKKDADGIEYNSPDACCMENLAIQLKTIENLHKIRFPFSEYGHGGYIYTEDGKKIHDSILEEFKELRGI